MTHRAKRLVLLRPGNNTFASKTEIVYTFLRLKVDRLCSEIYSSYLPFVFVVSQQRESTVYVDEMVIVRPARGKRSPKSK